MWIDTAKFHNLFHHSKLTIVMGDFNCKHPTWSLTSTNENGRKLYNLASGFFVGAPWEPTHVPFHQGHHSQVLDLMCASNLLYHYQMQVLKELNSDHWPVALQLHNIPLHCNPGPRRKTDWDAYRTQLANQREAELTHLHTTPTAI
ncbi:hypothetical protein JGG68_24600, partial [Salmonella enterica subsp. enterica serovar Albany]|nr:hypothetical protein [Salmonella enterica subsp. enterica serovar Albany]